MISTYESSPKWLPNEQVSQNDDRFCAAGLVQIRARREAPKRPNLRVSGAVHYGQVALGHEASSSAQFFQVLVHAPALAVASQLLVPGQGSASKRTAHTPARVFAHE